MITKTKEVMEKLEIGIFEILIGIFFIAGLIGYFFGVPADIEWLDHTISFVIFSDSFYKADLTSIIFGKSSRRINLLIIASYFFIFFKDIINYTA